MFCKTFVNLGAAFVSLVGGAGLHAARASEVYKGLGMHYKGLGRHYIGLGRHYIGLALFGNNPPPKTFVTFVNHMGAARLHSVRASEVTKVWECITKVWECITKVWEDIT